MPATGHPAAAISRAGPLDGQVALITGGARGIGRGIARCLLDAGAQVAIASRTASDLEVAVEELAAGGALMADVCDCSSEPDVCALVDGVVDRFGRLDILICCHGVYEAGLTALEIPLERFERTLAINLTGTFLCAQAAGRVMVAAGRGGRIVFISSMNALQAEAGCADYNTSKAAMHGLMRSLAVELGPLGITANAIAPGWIATPMSARDIEEYGDVVFNPRHTVGAPQDIGLAATWLADPRNHFVNGTVITVDGGETAMLPVPWHPTPAP